MKIGVPYIDLQSAQSADNRVFQTEYMKALGIEAQAALEAYIRASGKFKAIQSEIRRSWEDRFLQLWHAQSGFGRVSRFSIRNNPRLTGEYLLAQEGNIVNVDDNLRPWVRIVETKYFRKNLTLRSDWEAHGVNAEFLLENAVTPADANEGVSS